MKALSIFFSLFLLFTFSVYADELTDKLKNNLAEQQKLVQAIQDAQTQERSLKQQMVYMDDQVRLTTLKIDETSTKMESLNFDIASLSAKILRLEDSLDNISQVLISRISTTYKRGNLNPVELLLSSKGFSDLLAKLKYVKVVQSHDKKLMYEMEQTKTDYKEQKATLEVKKEEVELLQKQLQGYKNALSQQKKDKQKLLDITKNDEVKYQKLLEESKAEAESIQAIIGGKGIETESGKVNEGNRIASVIQGASCNSGGTHLHFSVKENGSAKNPFNYLKSGIDFENCSGSDCGNSNADPFNPSGNWNWPLNSKIEFYQGFGNTWAINHYSWLWYKFHDGIDIYGSSPDVKAVKSGTLYRGSYIGNQGCTLRYVRVKHDDSSIDTFYIHINY